MLATRVAAVFVALGIAGCGDNVHRPEPVGVSVAIVGGPSGLTRDPTPTWTFTTSGAPLSVDCAIDGAMPVTCRDSFTPAASLADGEHTFAVRVAGADGAEAADHRTIQIDTVAPRIALQSPIPVRTSDARP